jgi:ribonucleoside-triphosphate reductase
VTGLQVTKRDGRVVPFDPSRIERAIRLAWKAAHPEIEDRLLAENAATSASEAYGRVVAHVASGDDGSLGVERIQDLVEECLMEAGAYDVARAYILYRAEHARQREGRPIPPEVKDAFDESAAYFPTPLQQFQFFDKYSRYNPELGRRETWKETVDRCVDFLRELSEDRLPDDTYRRIRAAILGMRVMPSMRLLAMAGPAMRRNSMAGYNCSFVAVDSLDAFSEALLISMAGCGVGFSVERAHIEKLPRVAPQTGYVAAPWIVSDSAEGWADALREGLGRWFLGHDIRFDYSLVRPAGSVLRTKGGRASGPEPLKKMLDFCRERILARQGRKLRPIDAHDMMCMVGSAAVSGGVRRTAMISLFDEDDEEMLSAKAPGFDQQHPYRWNANNSAVRSAASMADQQEFARRFLAMVESGNGEPGIFSREVANALKPERRRAWAFGTNPCGEINLRSMEFCNLSAAVVRADDTYESLAEKVGLATIVGTIQSMATTFPGLRPEWKANCEEERLLGVDITGQQDNPSLLTEQVFRRLRRHARDVNAAVAGLLGINPSAAVTCVKPSGNTSQLVDCASGLHARWAPYYVRNVRLASTSPLFPVLKDAGVPMAPENGQDPLNPLTWVVSFPVKAPDGAATRNDRSAVEQCEWWLRNKLHWTEHNPSVTITYKRSEVLDLMKWVWDHREQVGGMAFLPSFDARYDQLPYIEITKEEYERRSAAFPAIDFSKIYRYERDDRSTASSTGACEGPVCLIEEGAA